MCPTEFALGVRETMRRHRMVTSGEALVVGVSGGPDSLALLSALVELRGELSLRLHVGHLHHGLRGDDADADLHLVQRIAADWGVPFTAHRADVPGDMARSRVSEEIAGRGARYAFLCSLAREVGAGAIATGHNLNDQAETVLMRVLRGTGVDGLAGIPPVGIAPDPEGGPAVRVIRPLIRTSREEIVRYCELRGLAYRTDPSNLNPAYLRNRVRLQLMPLLRESYNPNLDHALANLADVLREESDLVQVLADEAWSAALIHAGGDSVTLRLSALNPAIALRRRVMRRVLLHLDPDHVPHFGTVERLVDASFQERVPRFDVEGGLCVEVKGGVLKAAKQHRG